MDKNTKKTVGVKDILKSGNFRHTYSTEIETWEPSYSIEKKKPTTHTYNTLQNQRKTPRDPHELQNLIQQSYTVYIYQTIKKETTRSTTTD